jgi:Tfp pilus assembly protein PilF
MSKTVALALVLALPGLANAEPMDTSCTNGVCQTRFTVEQMLAHASMLVQARRFDEARPFVAALGQAPGLAMESHFLAGYIAVETGDVDAAIDQFRASLAADPKQTRVRLELARADDEA